VNEEALAPHGAVMQKEKYYTGYSLYMAIQNNENFQKCIAQ
jgi:hypothetical protein